MNRFKQVVNQHLNHLRCREDYLAAAAEVPLTQMLEWLNDGDSRKLSREHVNRVAVALVFLYDQAGDSSAIDHIDVILAELMDAAGCSAPPWSRAA